MIHTSGFAFEMYVTVSGERICAGFIAPCVNVGLVCLMDAIHFPDYRANLCCGAESAQRLGICIGEIEGPAIKEGIR